MPFIRPVLTLLTVDGIRTLLSQQTLAISLKSSTDSTGGQRVAYFRRTDQLVPRCVRLVVACYLIKQWRQHGPTNY
jgi:hypothetical protein